MYIEDLCLSKLHTLVHSSHVQKVCAPLLKLGINYFSMLRIYDDKKVIRLANQNAWTEYTHQENLYSRTNQLPLYPSHYVGVNQVVDENVLNIIKDYGSEQGFMINFRYEDYVDRYYFCFTLGQGFMQSMVLERLEVLYQFLAYFHEQTQTLILDIQKNQPVYVSDFPVADEGKNINALINSFLDEVSLKHLTLNIKGQAIKLTSQKIQLIQLWQQGLTAKKIAKETQLSYRTVQFYLQQLKEDVQAVGVDDLFDLKLPPYLIPR